MIDSDKIQQAAEAMYGQFVSSRPHKNSFLGGVHAGAMWAEHELSDEPKGMDLPDALRRLVLPGWEVCRASLYDEEGIEGWRWTDPDGNEYYEVGDWSEPPTWPDAGLAILAKATSREF